MASTNLNEKEQQLGSSSSFNTIIPSGSGANIIASSSHNQQQFTGQTANVAGISNTGGKSAAGAAADSGSIFIGIDQFGMSKVDFQTIKAASDTLKVFIF